MLSAVENFPNRESSEKGETGSPVTYLLGSVEPPPPPQKKKNKKKTTTTTTTTATTTKQNKKTLVHFLHD